MQPQYPPPQPQFPPAPQPPQYGPPPGYPPAPQYGPPPGYPPQPQYAPPPPVTPPVAGTLDDFYAQPSTGGGKSLAFEVVGTTYTGIVTRPISDADIEQQTNPQNNAPAFFKDGRPKFVMRVPLQMQPSPAYPDGLAQWYCRGSARDDLVRAMAEAGAPDGPPEAGAIITITMTGSRPSGPGLNPTKLFAVQYRRPMGATNGAAPAAPPLTNGAVPPTGYQPAPPPVYATNGAATVNPTGAMTLAGPPAPVPTPAPPAPAPPAPAPPPPPPPPAAPPAELSPEQRALLAQLTGQPAPAQ